MSNGISLSDGWSLLKDMLGTRNGTSADDISNADVEKFLKEADLNKDGKVTQDEFQKCCENSCKYKEMEEKFLETFKKIAELDKVKETISAEDIETAVEEMEEVEEAEGAGGADDAGDVNAPGNAPPANNPPANNPPTDNGDENAVTSTVTAVTLTGNETSDELRTGRSDTLSQIDKLNADKANVKGSDEYKKAATEYENADTEYSKSLDNLDAIYQAKIEANEQLTAEEQAFVDAKAARDTAVSEVTAQEAVITGVNEQITALDTSISETNTQLSSLEEPSTDLIVPIYDEETGEQTGEDTTAYDAAMQAYEAEKTQLEAQIVDLESQKTDLVLQLGDEETKLTGLQEKVVEADLGIQTALENLNTAKQNSQDVSEDELKQIQTTQELQSEYVQTWQNLVTVEEQLTQQIEADIEQLRANLKTYDEALDKKDEEQNANLPEGMHYRNGFLYDGEGENEKLMMPVEQSENGPELPQGYTVNEENGTVVDEQGNVVGKVVKTSSDQNGDGTPDEVESIYLYTDAVVASSKDRSVYANLGSANSANDTFAEYLKTQDIDIETATDAELTAAVSDYNKLNSQKNEFIRLYNQFSADENLAKYLDQEYQLTDSDYSGGYALQTLDRLNYYVTEIGAFNNGIRWNAGDSYNDDFAERVPSAIEHMKAILEEVNSVDMRVQTENGNI